MSPSSDADAKTTKERKDHLGDFEVVRKEYNFSHIWTFTVADALKKASLALAPIFSKTPLPAQ